MVTARDAMAREASRTLTEYREKRIDARQAVYQLYACGYTTSEALAEVEKKG